VPRSEISEFDKAHVGDILAGHGDWFSAKLLRLIAESDHDNREALREAYPGHVAAYEAWHNGEYIVVADTLEAAEVAIFGPEEAARRREARDGSG